MSAARDEDYTRPWSLLPELEHFEQVPKCRRVQKECPSLGVGTAGQRWHEILGFLEGENELQRCHGGRWPMASSAALPRYGRLSYFWSLPTSCVWSVLEEAWNMT